MTSVELGAPKICGDLLIQEPKRESPECHSNRQPIAKHHQRCMFQTPRSETYEIQQKGIVDLILLSYSSHIAKGLWLGMK